MVEPEKKVLQIPIFDKDSSFSFIDKQVSFGPRVPNTDAHKKCRTWLVEKLKSYGATVIEQEFKATQYTVCPKRKFGNTIKKIRIRFIQF